MDFNLLPPRIQLSKSTRLSCGLMHRNFHARYAHGIAGGSLCMKTLAAPQQEQQTDGRPWQGPGLLKISSSVCCPPNQLPQHRTHNHALSWPWEQEPQNGARMRTGWEQSAKKKPKAGKEWEQRMGTKWEQEPQKWDKNGNKVGTKWEQSGKKVGTKWKTKWEQEHQSGKRMGTKWKQSSHFVPLWSTCSPHFVPILVHFVPILVPLWGSCSHFVRFLSTLFHSCPTLRFLFPLCSPSCPTSGFLFPPCFHSCPTLGLFPLCSHFVPIVVLPRVPVPTLFPCGSCAHFVPLCSILVPLWGSCSHIVPILVSTWVQKPEQSWNKNLKVGTRMVTKTPK